jgi:CDGSH-type Zn-finger protein
MEALAKIKRGALGYSFLIMWRGKGETFETNATEIYQAARIAKEVGCDYFEYKPFVDSSHYLVPFDGDMRARIRDVHEACLELKDDNFDVVAPRSIQHLFELENPIQPKAYTKCPAMELRTLVTPTGVYPCPYMRGREDKKIGSISDGPFHEMWNSAKWIEGRRQTDPSKDCGFYCIRHRTNVVMDTLESLDRQGIPMLDHIVARDIPDPFF